MKPSERIGNLLFNEAGEIVEVISITKTHINGVELSKWKPVPLTAERLKIFGCKSDGEYAVLRFDPRMKIQFHKFNPAECDVVQDGNRISFRSSHLKYVHQFQNFYFDLSGEDLPIHKL